MTEPRNKKPEGKNGNGVDRFSPEYIAYLKEMESMGDDTFAKQIAKQARNGKIEPEVLKEVRETLRNPNLMENKDYKNFMKALGQGKFPKKAKFALRFLEALKGTEKEQEYAKDFIRHLSEESTSKLSERREKEALKKLTELHDEDITEQAMAETSAATQAITGTADIHNRVENIAKTPIKNNWELEKPPVELVKKLDELKVAQYAITQEYNLKEQELQNAEAAKVVDFAKVKILKAQLMKLDDDFEKLNEEYADERLEIQQFMDRNLARYRALGKFFKKAGIDVRTAERLKMWFLDLSQSPEHDAKKTSLKMMGMVTDPATGATHKQETQIEIRGLRFETTDRSGLDPSDAGDLLIQYVNEKGETSEAGYQNFLQMINAFEAYEEIDSLEELNQRSSEELVYADLAVGQEFETEVVVGHDAANKAIKEKSSFTVESIDEKRKIVKLSNTITKIPRQAMHLSVHNSLYFERKQRDFSFGEFAKMLKQRGYNRKASVAEMPEICAKASAQLQEECEGFAAGSSEELQKDFKALGGANVPKLDLPQPNETKEVLFLDNYNLLRWGNLTLEKGPDGLSTYKLKEIPHRFKKPGASMTDLLSAGVPTLFAAANRASTRWEKGDGKQILTPLELARIARDGTMTNAPTSKSPSTAKSPAGEWIADDESIAAMAHAGKDEVAHDAHPAEAHGAEHDAGAHDAGAHDAGHDAHGGAHGADHGAGDHGGGHDAHGGHGEHGHEKPKFYTEALPLDQVKKSGGMYTREQGFLVNLWNSTRFLSMNDCWKMGTSMWEFYNRRWERRQKDKYARVGEELPYFSPEMRRIVEATEHEEVHQYQEAFEHKGIYEIQFRLENTSNKDEFKAALTTLTDKGQLRWDSLKFWHNINRFVTGHATPIPIPANGDPYTRISKDDKRTGFDFLKGAIDSLWGEGQYDGFYSKNKSAYSSNSKGFYEEGKQLEGVDGGHELRLSTLLKQHKEGIYVNPHEYEGLILHSIEAGKSNMQSKIYFMIEGVAAANQSGRTIMSFDRIAHINSEMLNNFPILEYICAKVPRPPKGEGYRFTLDDYKQWVHTFDNGQPSNPANFKPGKAVDDFMWKYVIPSDETQNRINKALRNGEKLDHDDMFAYLPPATEGVITDACKATTGSKKFLTVEGYANVMPGFSQYMKSTADVGRLDKLKEAIKSYVRFEGIMTSRFDQTDTAHDSYQRMDYSTLNSPTICSTEPPQAFMDEMNAMTQAIVEAYGDSELNEVFADIKKPRVRDFTSKEGSEEQKKVNKAFREFGDIFNRVVKSDNGKKMQAIVKQTSLIGMPKYVSSEEKAKRKSTYSNKLALE